MLPLLKTTLSCMETALLGYGAALLRALAMCLNVAVLQLLGAVLRGIRCCMGACSTTVQKQERPIVTSCWSLPFEPLGLIMRSELGSGPRYMIHDSWHTFLHVERVRKHTDMLELHVLRVRFSYVCVFSDSRNVQKRATKSDTSGHCLE